jgi:CRISPR/Cas system-associated exonuclease Cas4 (RecB family)
MIPVSLLSGYLYCPRKVYLERVLELSVPAKDSGLRSTVRKIAYELVNQADEAIVRTISVSDSLDSIEAIYQKTYGLILQRVVHGNADALRKAGIDPPAIYKGYMRLLEAEAKHRARNVFEFITERHVFGDTLWEELSPKIKSEYRLTSEALQLSGTVDAVEIYPDHVVPVELKSGKAPREGIWPGHQIELASYMLLLEERFGMPVSHGRVRYVDESVMREVIMNPFLKQKVLDTRDAVQRLFDEAKIPPVIANEKKCISCGQRTACRDQNV